MQTFLKDTLVGFARKRALITGHTGFKGAWLSLWLRALGAEVYGYAQPPPTQPSLFALTGLKRDLHHETGDIGDVEHMRAYVREVRPDFVFHLAAQSLVRRSYEEPLETLATNVMGTANVLESLRQLDRPCAVVVVTSDKCYENQEWVYGYRESDPMGGSDPYSMSKGCAELVTACWRRSFLPPDGPIRIASARAGNVIGGGDFAEARLIPDCIRALTRDEPIHVRNPRAVRPWQHVLDPLSGYLGLAQRLLGSDGPRHCGAWNFGPVMAAQQPVSEVVRRLIEAWGSGIWKDVSDSVAPHEAQLLALCCDKAHARMGWQATWDLSESIRQTVQWYKVWREDRDGQALKDICSGQIDAFVADATRDRLLVKLPRL
jgi:CDP-glucose 4,6-dehydratase